MPAPRNATAAVPASATLTAYHAQYFAHEPSRRYPSDSAGKLPGSLFTVDALDPTDDHIIVAAAPDNGDMLDEETATRLLSLPSNRTGAIAIG